MEVGEAVESPVGDLVGAFVDTSVGASVDASIGVFVGPFVGSTVGSAVGFLVGFKGWNNILVFFYCFDHYSFRYKGPIFTLTIIPVTKIWFVPLNMRKIPLL